MRKFYELSAQLVSRGEKFTVETLALLSYDEVSLASWGNAGKAICSNETVEIELRRRREEVLGAASIEEVVRRFRNNEIPSRMFYDALEEKAASLPVVPEQDAPAWLVLYRAMTDLRGDWSGGRHSEHLKRIYELIPLATTEGVVPQGWLEAVKRNADEFDGEFCDGRIMRDGSRASGMSGNLAFLITGDDRIPTEDGFYGSYTELVEQILPSELVLLCFHKREEAED